MTDLLTRLLSERSTVVADGAMGTNLMAMGLASALAPELWNVAEPERVTQLHTAFIAAGADLILTNSFGANAIRLSRVGAERRVSELNLAAAALARSAARDDDRAIAVAGVIGPTGERIEPARARSVFAEQAAALAEGGVDVLWLETFSAIAELDAALDGADTAGLPVVATMTFGAASYTLADESPASVIAFLAKRRKPPIAFGANCGSGPGSVIEALRSLRAAEDVATNRLTLVAKANCGLPQQTTDGLVYPAAPATMARYARIARDAGARIVGGCCGATPSHVRAIATALTGYAPRPLATPDLVATDLASPNDSDTAPDRRV